MTTAGYPRALYPVLFQVKAVGIHLAVCNIRGRKALRTQTIMRARELTPSSGQNSRVERQLTEDMDGTVLSCGIEHKYRA